MSFKTDPCLVSSGNINPSVFVMVDTSNDFSVVQATANGQTIGVSQEGTKYAPGTAADSGYAFIQGDAVTLYSLGDVCLLTAGTGGWTRGDLIESDANGNGITSSTQGHNVGAVALESAAAGEKRLVQVVFKNHP